METSTDYRTLAQAFDCLNAELFAGSLPDVTVTIGDAITVQCRANTSGYYLHDAFVARGDATDRTDGASHCSEIALNPANFTRRTDAEILSTLAHEMAHLWQFAHGALSSAEAPGRYGYHNAERARKLQRHRRWREIGLEPVRSDGTLSTAKAPGKTGDKMTHRLLARGRFDQVTTRFLAGSRLRWQSFDLPEGTLTGRQATAKKKAASKIKYTCPGCEQNAWAKPDAELTCTPCGEPMEPKDASAGAEGDEQDPDEN